MQQQIQTTKYMPYNIQNCVNIKNNIKYEIKYEIRKQKKNTTV